ncbi:HAD-IA family hydrolase [Pseudomonas syringae]|jgi:HAD superfamily hydrolase (TIGR01509 family)|nr:HAD-IA family hydrolase [Pseudomonas syringae]
MKALTDMLIVFDLGGVLVELGPDIRLHARPDAAVEVDGLLRQYCLGLISTQVFSERLSDIYNWADGPKSFVQWFVRRRITGVQPGAERLLTELASRQVAVALFSNINEAVWTSLNKYPVLDACAYKLLSFQHHLMKPDQRFNKLVEDVSGYDKGQILYFDDSAANIEAGHARGWVSHLVNPDTAIKEIRQYLESYDSDAVI